MKVDTFESLGNCCDLRSLPVGFPKILAIIMVALVMSVPGLSFAQSLPKWNLADIPREDLMPPTGRPWMKDCWSESEKDGDVAFRNAHDNWEDFIVVKAWWKDGQLRPDDGSRYILTLTYKDVLSSPATFSLFAGLGGVEYTSPVILFGGLNDGKWKTVDIPISWDMIARLPSKPGSTMFSIRPPKVKLPVGKMELREAKDEDREKYFQHMRDMIALAQKDKLSDVKIETKSPTFTKNKGSAVVGFTWNTLVPLLADMQPKDDQIGVPLKIRMCRNETEGASFGVYANGKELTGVDYEISQLQDSSGKALACTIVRRTAEYCVTQSRAKSQKHKWFPQRLWPAYKTNVPSGRSQWMWADITTDAAKSTPGTYKGTIKITSGQGTAEIPLEVEVLPIELLPMDQSDTCMGGFTSSLMPQQDVEFQVSYNQGQTSIWYFPTPTPMSMDGGKLKVDFQYLDDYLTRAKKAGFKRAVYFMGGEPYGWPYTCFLEMDIGRAMGMKDKDIVAEQNACKTGLAPKFRENYKEWFRQFKALADQRKDKWIEVVFTPMDEPAKWAQNHKNEFAREGAIGSGEWLKPYFKDCCKAIKEVSPDLKIYGSIHNDTKGEGICFLDDIDIFCTNMIGTGKDSTECLTKVPAAGKQFWQYSGCRDMDSQDLARFCYGWYFAAYNARGMFCWAYNWSAFFECSDKYGWAYGWQSPYGTIPAPFFMGIRDACDDRRAIATLRKKLGTGAEAILKPMFEECRKSKKPGAGDDTVVDFYNQIDDAGKMDRWRNTVLNALKGSPGK